MQEFMPKLMAGWATFGAYFELPALLGEEHSLEAKYNVLCLSFQRKKLPCAVGAWELNLEV